MSISCLCSYPRLAVCCGHNFCTTCLERYLQSKSTEHDSCPYCREEKFKTVPDKRTERYVLNLKVFCPHKYQGCTWVGELRSMEDHVNENSNHNIGCPFTELQCSNGCGVVMQRRLVEGHLKSECELREVKCEYCNTTGSYQWINSSHCEECPKYPVECPNHCEVGHMRREEISRHLEECPLTIVECPYAVVGCESVVRRKEKMEHLMGSVGQHMEYNKNTILTNQNEFLKRLDVKEREMENMKQDLQDTKDKLREIQSQLQTAITEKGRELNEVRKNAENNNKTLQKMLQQLKDKLEESEQSFQHQVKVNAQLQLQVETLSNSTWPLQLNYLANSGNEVVPVVIKLAEFKNNTVFYSKGFYTRDRGYKMYLFVNPIYNNDLSITTGLMKGDHDVHLTWPVKGTLTVQLLNQLSDSNHSKPVEFHFDGSSKECQRVTKETVLWYGELSRDFQMPHKRLSYYANKNRQCLKDDCMFIRVCSFQ